MQAVKQMLKKIENGTIVTPQGFQAAGLHTKVKRKRNDLGAIVSEVPANAAAVYTLSKVVAAPISVTKDSLAQAGKLQAVVVNSGNANACTGKKGLEDAYTMRNTFAELLSVAPHFVAVASTGVIGEEMPMEKITSGIKSLKPTATVEGAKAFNEAILTTDTCMKTACYETLIDGKKVTLAGTAKGSGMLAPNMGTMLAFITTDANVDQQSLQLALNEVIDETFNLVTIDGDTSTNDTVVTMANGLANNEPLTPTHKEWNVFLQLLKQVCEDLAILIARDGEGATKLIEVEVKGALNKEEANKIAKTVVGSNLVKTMVYGADPNWGRIMMAIGKSGMTIDSENVDIAIGSFPILKRSQPIAYSEEGLEKYLNESSIKIVIDVHVGNSTGKAWGCDLTYDYVKINASYRT